MKVVGIMSGTSMDGVDLCLAEISESNGSWDYKILARETVPFEEKWRVRLSQLRYQNSEVYVKTDIFFGKYLGELVNNFLQKNNESAELVASHGHTVFHDPAGWITSQAGDGATLSATSGLPVVSNFRRADVALGGQGAPLVGIGDDIFFGEYDACLNLGGFCNISANIEGKRIAYDVAPCNIILNRLARDRGQKYDVNGQIAEAGEVIYPLLNDLNEIPFYKKSWPKSLGREWINKEFWYIVRDFDSEPLENRMKTLVMHIAQQVANTIDHLFGENGNGKKILVTGGGANNLCLVDYLRSESDAEIVIPENDIVEYKEALVFGLLGAMRVKNITNTQGSATGAKASTIAGSLDGNFANLIS
ncbi:MAG: anhydro-N-acetylmuramic acid kinase [Bacteroidetes bacterium]|nr:anhydro-N-acetylmuramic acid kinase [Bacteroidota bacterium]